MTIAEELFDIANATDEALKLLADDSVQRPLSEIRKVVEEAKRSWSGSNIGYHASVYYAGLQPSPPRAQFNAEWGLLDRWPTHQPDPGWQIMDRQAVLDELLSRAGNPNLDEIEKKIGSLRNKFSSLKEQAISLLTAALAEKSDTFLDRKLKQIEPLFYATPDTIAQDLLPNGRVWSRDSKAATQGLRVAPHQTLVAFDLSATVLRNGLSTLATTTREAASHVQRLLNSDRKRLVGTNVFIRHGS